MRLKLPRYVQGFPDRYGKPRYYLRKPGLPRVSLPGVPWTPRFMAAYEAALAGERLQIAENRTSPGTVNALAVAYFNSADFRTLSPSTQKTYRGIVDILRRVAGDKSVRALRREHVARMMSEKAATPAAANNLLRIVRLLMKFAVVHGWRGDDPTVGVKALRTSSSGFYTWTEDDIAAFKAKHAIGSRARLAMALLLFTAQRRSDVVRIGRQHLRDGILSIRQQKTKTLVEIPLHSQLREVLEATPNAHLTFLVTEGGKPFTAAGFGNWFRAKCEDANLPKGCAAHGLRKAASRRLAEAGCTAHQIMSITGHRSLREVTRYTEAANRRHLAATAIAKLGSGTATVKPR